MRIPAPELLLIVSCCQWNVERGYQLQKIIHALSEANADVIALQEIDVGCERSNRVDVGEAMTVQVPQVGA